MFDPNEYADVKTVLLIFSSNQFTVSNEFFAHVGVWLMKVPQYIYVLRFENEDTASYFQLGIMYQRNKSLNLIPNDLMVSRSDILS